MSKILDKIKNPRQILDNIKNSRQIKDKNSPKSKTNSRKKMSQKKLSQYIQSEPNWLSITYNLGTDLHLH